MQKEWSSFRITLVLYVVVLLLPFSFYFVSSSFKMMQGDTKIVRQSSWVAGAMLIADEEGSSQIDKALTDISEWVGKNSDSVYYTGTDTLKKDFDNVQSCWKSVKKVSERSSALTCYRNADKLANIIEKMVYLKQKKLINLFYASLAVATLLALLIIYLVRVYIHQQMKKHAIHDHDTHLSAILKMMPIRRRCRNTSPKRPRICSVHLPGRVMSSAGMIRTILWYSWSIRSMRMHFILQSVSKKHSLHMTSIPNRSLSSNSIQFSSIRQKLSKGLLREE